MSICASQMQARSVVRLLNDVADTVDCSVDADAQLQCGYCRTFVPASDLAASAHDVERSIGVCFECVSSKRTNNLKYSLSCKGKRSIEHSRRTKRRGQREREGERKREKRRLAAGRWSDEEWATWWAERLPRLFAEDSDEEPA